MNMDLKFSRSRVTMSNLNMVGLVMCLVGIFCHIIHKFYAFRQSRRGSTHSQNIENDTFEMCGAHDDACTINDNGDLAKVATISVYMDGNKSDSDGRAFYIRIQYGCSCRIQSD